MDKLKGKIAYITGGSKGIGYGIARTLMDNGLKVAISGRHKADIDKAVDFLRTKGLATYQIR